MTCMLCSSISTNLLKAHIHSGYIVNVMRSPVFERLIARGSQVALKHVIRDMEARTLVMELRRRAIKRWGGGKVALPLTPKIG